MGLLLVSYNIQYSMSALKTDMDFFLRCVSLKKNKPSTTFSHVPMQNQNSWDV